MRVARFVGMAVAVAVTFLGCATTGEIPAGLDSDQAIYISPAVEDGVQDAVTFELVVTPLERTRLTSYAVVVTNGAGAVIYRIEEATPELGFFARLFGPGRRAEVDPPQVVLWDGRDNAGDFVADGTYSLAVSVQDNRGNSGGAGPIEIVVDNTPPSVEVSAPYTLFTPNGDDRLDVLSVYQRRSTSENEWTGEMLDAGGVPVRTFSWQGGARDFLWDGSTDAGSVAAEGAFTYRVSATDRAGNTGRFELPGITLETDPRPAVVSVNRPSFSPNGDGRADTIGINPRAQITENLESWSIEIRDVAGAAVRTFTGNRTPAAFDYDGTDTDGALVADGIYRAVLTLRYTGGQTPQTASNPFVVDTSPPQATVRVNTPVFSPDGDGAKDSVEVLQSSSEEREWIGTLTDAGGQAVLGQSWTGRVGSFVWDGTDAQGAVLPDGTYTWTLQAVDEAENEARPVTTRIRLDTRPTPVRVSASGRGFSPNGDGISDNVGYSFQASVSEEIERWSLAILNASGARVGEVAAGEVLPESVSWDGALAGTRAADGEYLAELTVTYAKGNVATGRSNPVRVDTQAPVVTVTAVPALFSPDDDGENDTLAITITTRDPSPIARWEASMIDPAGHPFVSWSGTGAPRSPIRWDGRSASGELVQSAEDYTLVVSATDSVWNSGETTAVVPIDILVIREGDRLRIRISSIYFVPFTADYTNLEPEQVARNLETLDRLAVVLNKYPQHTIRVEGHAVQVLWADAARARVEQNEVLIPLSLARAEAIKKALARRGLASARMTTDGYGGSLPVVPHSDLENRWKNRRVEFILERRR